MVQPSILKSAEDWFRKMGWVPFDFQRQAWTSYLAGKSGLVNAPTGSGKTYALMIPAIINANDLQSADKVRLIWITPIRALAKEIHIAGERAAAGLGLEWTIAVRTGDTSSAEKERQKKHPPHCLITTPETLHLLLAQKNYPGYFSGLKGIVVDEWHELMGSKRGVLMELALSRLKTVAPGLRIWGISATIGNLKEALKVLLGNGYKHQNNNLIRADIQKKIEVNTIMPDEVERLPWAGHLGISLLEKVIPILQESESTLLFTNTRSQCEIWYKKLLEADPTLAGQIAMHHGSISRELRDWVEESLHNGDIKAVVCTSSLDLGVDFRPVDTIIQIGSPKGVARFLQRAGRSGHQPGATSVIHFLPTHSLELMESAALRTAMQDASIESRIPYIRSFDVLVQYLITLSVGEGFRPAEIFPEISRTHAFESISEDEWRWMLSFITTGGQSLHAYEEYHKVEIEDGVYKIKDKRMAMRHRLSIGTIVSDSMMKVKYLSGGYLGSIEEWFISRLHPGDTFWFAGRALELFQIKNMVVLVKKSKSKSGRIPSYLGGRLPLSNQMSRVLRQKMSEASLGIASDPEVVKLQPLIELQELRSHMPNEGEFLIEKMQSREGWHVFMYPFEGRNVHEGIASLVAYRISQLQPITFSLAYNDYGLELLSDQEILIEEVLDSDIFTSDHLLADIHASVNANEMARRKFRDIASISGLVFQGYPGKYKADKHLQNSAGLLFKVFEEYDNQNLLLRQAYEEVLQFQLEEERLRQALDRISGQQIIIEYPDRPTPLSFPILVDRLRESMSSEKLEDRIRKMKLQFE